MIRGVDVSRHQGDIDWNIVKSSGIKFAIIRAGLGSNQVNQDDEKAEINITECERLGIPYGLYIYSYALNDADGVSEAKHAIRIALGHKPSLGIYIDMEDADGYKSRHGIPLDFSNSALYTNICAAFTNTISNSGYIAGVYASKYVLENIIRNDYLTNSGVKIWVAQWGKECTYSGNYNLWQYSDSGVVPGISGKSDMNYLVNDIKVSENKGEYGKTVKVWRAVKVSSYYRNPYDTYDKAIIKNAQGIITEMLPGAINPFHIGELDVWVNEGDIRQDISNQIVKLSNNPKIESYVVKKGDTLSEIALKYNTNYLKIAKENNIKNPDLIYPGQRLKII